jgi:hypothetical protein
MLCASPGKQRNPLQIDGAWRIRRQLSGQLDAIIGLFKALFIPLLGEGLRANYEK